jgi:hypothetical protein
LVNSYIHALKGRVVKSDSGATFTVLVAVVPLLLVETNGDGSADTFSAVFGAIRATADFEHRQFIFWGQ